MSREKKLKFFSDLKHYSECVGISMEILHACFVHLHIICISKNLSVFTDELAVILSFEFQVDNNWFSVSGKIYLYTIKIQYSMHVKMHSMLIV